MKKVIFVLTFLFLASTVSFADSSVQFFKKSQANRVVNYLNNHPEMLFYCGCYPDFQTTYVYALDVWMERYSLTYYEVWIYGFVVKTNEEIYTPVDLNCVWVEGNNGYPANVAQILGFKHRVCEANFRWRIPIYNARPRVIHPATYQHNYFGQPNVKPRKPKAPQHNPEPKYVGKPQHNNGPATNNSNRTTTTQPKPQPNNNGGNGHNNNNGGSNNRSYNSGSTSGSNTPKPNTQTTKPKSNSSTSTSNSRNSNARK
jgi:hypothetical protein